VTEDEEYTQRTMISGLGGARFMADFYSREKIRAAVAHLLTCHGHHFAVIGEGHQLVMSHLAVECLRREKLLPLIVYEGNGHGE
jgi:hypothetical protein